MTSSIHPTVHLANGTKIVGKWHRQTYKVIRQIGEGARGSIYLVRGSQGLNALKISKDPFVITREAKILRLMKKVQGVQLGPFLIDVDDFTYRKTQYSFYVMEYVDGVRIKDWYHPSKASHLAIVIKQLLFKLHHLHLSGYIFGDLKLENLLIDRQSKQVRLVDFGGVTQLGRSVREYTSHYDRGYWQMGERKADPAYDLFAVAICILQLDPTFKRMATNQRNLVKLIDQSRTLEPYHPILKKAVQGQYQQAMEMKKDLNRLKLNRQRKTVRRKNPSLTKKTANQPNIQHLHPAKQTMKKEVIGIGSLLFVQFSLLAGFYYWF
ncbi:MULTISPECIES: serine/threonine-protein kinase [Allobacillus]|uniref:Serine/threonine protein kinase n=1 Tax=Allobacillus salarius TaxID=1955272 RepID=A0A556P6U1_9BACI|nr:serine/threonine-protein kinase [Allobacillus salarius]TSJ60113.1 serine/threonine protein kinase [Allobacillus salarius]